jgi:protein SCO1/2
MQPDTHRVTRPFILFVALFSALVGLFTYSGDSSASSSVSSGTANLPAAGAKIPPELKDAVIQEKLGAQIDFSQLDFTNEQGQKVPISSFFHTGKPVILTLVYYSCPSLCGFFLNGLLDSLKRFEWNVGTRFEIVTLSINHREGADLAAAKKETLLKAYGRAGSGPGWHFLTGDEQSIKRLASQVGFGYRYDEKEKQYAHSAAAIVLTPEGKVSRYLYGISFEPKDLKLSILEASSGKVSTVLEQVLLFCYRYDPHARGYSLAVFRILQASSAAMVVLVFGYLLIFWRRQRRLLREV